MRRGASPPRRLTAVSGSTASAGSIGASAGSIGAATSAAGAADTLSTYIREPLFTVPGQEPSFEAQALQATTTACRPGGSGASTFARTSYCRTSIPSERGTPATAPAAVASNCAPSTVIVAPGANACPAGVSAVTRNRGVPPGTSSCHRRRSTAPGGHGSGSGSVYTRPRPVLIRRLEEEGAAGELGPRLGPVSGVVRGEQRRVRGRPLRPV